jgi:signal peptide peptidase SppA
MKNYRHIIEYVNGHAWPILPEKGAIIADALQRRLRGASQELELEDADILEVLGNQKASAGGITGAVAVLPIFGTICHRAGSLREWSGGTSTERVGQAVRQAMNDPAVGALVLDVDSPGGTDAGVSELFDLIYESRGKKPIVAVANALMASAAYWIGCAADELVATKSALVGSIGVYMMHIDESKLLENEGIAVTLISAGKNKVRGNPFAPLKDEDRERFQEIVNSVYSRFTKSVSKGRGVSTEVVRSNYGQGDILTADEALAAGMIDRVDTLENTIARLGRQIKKGAVAVEAQPTEVANKAEVPGGQTAGDLDLRRRRLGLYEKTS